MNSKKRAIYKKLKGFVSKKTIEKYANLNYKKKVKKNRYNPNKILIGITLFCGSLFVYHIFCLYKKHKNEKNNLKQKVNIVPLSGIY